MTKPFVQTVDCKKGYITSVLMHKGGLKVDTSGILETRLDPVAQAMSECLQAVVAAALAVQASAPIVLNRHLH